MNCFLPIDLIKFFIKTYISTALYKVKINLENMAREVKYVMAELVQGFTVFGGILFLIEKWKLGGSLQLLLATHQSIIIFCQIKIIQICSFMRHKFTALKKISLKGNLTFLF